MRVYRAETGQIIQWFSNETIIKDVQDFKKAIEQDVGVPIEDQILITDFGKLVRDDNLRQILESTGKDEYIVFCYDRRYLGAMDEDVQALIDAETPPLEPDIPSFNGPLIFNQFKNSLHRLSLDDTSTAYLSLFVRFESYNQVILRSTAAHSQLSRWIVAEQKMQSMALQVAMTNLESHTRLAEACIQLFVSKAGKEHYRQQSLLNSLNDDLTILKNVKIHPTILSILNPVHQQKKRLIDFVDQSHISIVREDTLRLCDYLSSHIRSLGEEMKALKLEETKFREQVHINSNLQSLDGTLAEIQSLEQEIQKKRSRTERDFKRVCELIAKLLDKPVSSLLDALPASFMLESTLLSSPQSSSPVSPILPLRRGIKDEIKASDKKKALESMLHLVEFHVNDYLPKMSQYEHTIRQKTFELIMSKRKSIQTFISNMAVVSKFEQHVGKIQPDVDQHMQYLSEFKQKYNNKDLESLRDILFAYGAIMIELLRRKEYSKLLVSNASSIADIFSQYRTDEENRREHFRHIISKSFPFKVINSIIDSASAQCEISVNGANNNDSNDLKKQDISEFISLITQVYSSSPQLIHSRKRQSKRGASKFISGTYQDEEKFLNLLRQMVKEIEDMHSHFLSSINKQFFEDQKTIDYASDDIFSQRFEQLNVARSPTISTYSVVEDEKDVSDDIKRKLESAEEDILLLEQKNNEQTDEINHLREIIKNLESEKDEFESHRKSFLNELKNKDITADFRLQTAEEDFHANLSDLQYQLEEERRMKKNLEIEHASELNTLQNEHAEDIKKLTTLLQQEREKTTFLEKEKQELIERNDQLRDSLNTIKDKLATERREHETKVSQIQSELEEKERVTEEIMLLQQQTRTMVKKAQDDWESKNEELTKIKKEHDAVEAAVKDLLQRFRPNDPNLHRMSLDVYIKSFKETLETFERDYDLTKDNLNAISQELADVTEGYTNLIEVNNEWRVIGSRMAEKLEEYRKNVIFEINNQLQLPMDEEELNILQKRVTPSEDDTAIWSQILQLASAINTQKFVLRVHRRVKDSYEQAKQYKKEYKSIKEKYNKLCTVYCEKIAFRNFKVGDVALFLPTRNSTGKPWAAFNINAPHYFLKSTENNATQMQSKEWIVARIVKITEHIAVENDNPYGLGDNVKYHLIEVEHWRNNKQHVSKKRHTSHDMGLASITLPSESGSIHGQQTTGLQGNFVHTYTTQQHNTK